MMQRTCWIRQRKCSQIPALLAEHDIEAQAKRKPSVVRQYVVSVSAAVVCQVIDPNACCMSALISMLGSQPGCSSRFEDGTKRTRRT